MDRYRTLGIHKRTIKQIHKKEMKTELIKEKYHHYGLDKEDVFKHQHYVIITRSGIDKIQAIENITIDYEVINCDRDFCVVKANATMSKHLLNNSSDRVAKIQTFGSALKGDFKLP